MNIIRMAQEAGFTVDESLGVPYALLNEKTLLEFNVALERFAALVAAAEREACAKVAESNVWSKDVAWWQEVTKSEVSVESSIQCAAAIRARGQE